MKTSSAQFPNCASAKILRHNDLWATVISHQESTFSENFSENSTHPTNLASFGGRAHFEKKAQRGCLRSDLEKKL